MFGKTPNQMMFDAVLQSKTNEIKQFISQGFDLSQNYGGLTLLDYALIHDLKASSTLIQQHGGVQNLSTEEILKSRQSLTNQIASDYQYQIKIVKVSNCAPKVDVILKDVNTGAEFSRDQISYSNLSQIGVISDSVAICMVGEQPCVTVLDKQSKQPTAMFHITDSETVEVQSIKSEGGVYSIASDIPIHLQKSIQLKSLEIIAPKLNIDKDIRVKSESLLFNISGDISQNGLLVTNTLQMHGQHLNIHGNIAALKSFDIQCKGQLNHYGSLSAMRDGNIKAHAVEIHRESTVQAPGGTLKIFGDAWLKNSGALIADYMVLDSNTLVNNYYAGMIKAVTCVVPPKLNQFNNSGFYLIGRKNTLSILDNAFSVSNAAISIANVFGLMTTNTYQNLKSGVLLGQACYQGASIVNKLYQGQTDDISKDELVHLVLDSIVPFIGSYTDKESKSRFVSTVLYQSFAWYLGEDAFIDKSLNLVEMITRGVATFSEGVISAEDIASLEELAKYIQYSRVALKFALAGCDSAQAYLSGDPLAISNARDTFSAVAESGFRDWLQTMQPEIMFGIEFNPRDLALFILNKGHEQKFEVGLKRAVYAFIYALHKSEIVTDDIKVDLQRDVQLAFSSITWVKLYNSYQKGEISYSALLQQVFNEVVAFSSYRATKNQIKMQEEANADFEQTIEEMESDQVLEHELALNSHDQSTDIALQEDVKVDSEPASEEKPEEQPEAEPFEVLEEAYKPTEAEVTAQVEQAASEVLVDYQRKSMTFTVDVEQLVDDMLHPQEAAASNEAILDKELADLETLDTKTILSELYAKGMQSTYAQSLLEIQHVIDGDYASQGYMGVFANTLHNSGVLDVVGSMQLDFKKGTNSSLIRATNDVSLHGKDIHNRDKDSKVINSEVAQSDSISNFTNHDSGTIHAGGYFQSSAVGQIDNHGDIHATKELDVLNTKRVINHEHSTMHSDRDVTVLADTETENAGRMMGQNILLEGATKQVRNTGDIAAQENIHLASAGDVSHESGSLSGQKILLSGVSLNKQGKVNALLVKTGGYDSDTPNSIDWKAAEDNVFGLILKPGSGTLAYSPDAFNGVQVTDLQLQADHLASEQLLNVDPNFQNILQLQLPGSDRVFSVAELPTIAPNATFILHAPGATLEACQNNGFDYQSILKFVGTHFEHSGVNTFQQAYFDVQSFSGSNAIDALNLREGGGIQAYDFSNQGHIASAGPLGWNVDNFTNDAALESFGEYFTHSKENNVQDYTVSTRVVSDSGTIHAHAHSGYIGQLNQTGGSLTSSDGGNFLYVQDAKLEALFSSHGEYTRGVIEDVGWSWHITPEAHNAKIGSSGDSVVLGNGEMTLAGADLWGDKGNYAYFNEGITCERNAVAYQIQQAKRHGKGRNREVTVPAQSLEMVAENHIDSNGGDIVLASANASVELGSTILATPGNATIIAKDKVIVDGEIINRHEQSQYKIKGPIHTKKVTSTTDVSEIQSSYLFVGGTLTISAMDVALKGVKGIVGNMDVTAINTTLSGKEERYENTTTTKEMRIGLPCDNLVSILSGHNARAIFSTVIQSYGWNQSELDALMNADSLTEVPGPLLEVAKNTWNLTALVAHACNEYSHGDATPGKFIGSVTEQIGLTTKDSNDHYILNPKFRLTMSENKEHTEQTHTVSTDLYIGGTFKLTGGTLNVFDGSKVNAKDLIISLANGINMTESLDTSSYCSKVKTGSLGINVMNPKDFDVSVGKDIASSSSFDANLAGLQARDTVHIDAEYIRGEGSVKAVKGKIVVPEVNLSSVQNSHQTFNKSVGAHVSTSMGADGGTDIDAIGGHYHKSTSDILTTDETAGIFMPEGTLETNRVHLGNGATIDVQALHRADGEEGLPTITGTTAIDHDIQKQDGFSFNITKEPGANLQHSNTHEERVHRPSVFAQNIHPGDIAGINTERERQTEVTRSSRSAFNIAGFVPNADKYQGDLVEIKEAAGHVIDGVTSVLESTSRTLNFSYGQAQSRQKPVDETLIATDAPVCLAEQPSEKCSEDITAEINQPTAEPKELPVEKMDAPIQEPIDDVSVLNSELNGAISEIPGLADLQSVVGASLFLSQYSDSEIYQLAKAVDDFHHGRPNRIIESAQQNVHKNAENALFSDFLRVMNPISDSWAVGSLPVFGTVALLSALGIITVGTRHNESADSAASQEDIILSPEQQAEMAVLNLGLAPYVSFLLTKWVKDFNNNDNSASSDPESFESHEGEEYTAIHRDEFNDGAVTPITGAQDSASSSFNIGLSEEDKAPNILITPIPETPTPTSLPGTSLNPIPLPFIETLPIHQEDTGPLIFPMPTEGETGNNILVTPVPNVFLPQFLMLEGAENIAKHENYKKDLEIQTCDSIFKPDGTLTDSAIDSSRFVKAGDKLGNKILTAELSARGNLSDWEKRRTLTFYTPVESENIGKSKRNIQGEVHFYKNKETNEVYYDMDYKVKYAISNNPHEPVSEFLDKLPKNWRPKP